MSEPLIKIATGPPTRAGRDFRLLIRCTCGAAGCELTSVSGWLSEPLGWVLAVAAERALRLYQNLAVEIVPDRLALRACQEAAIRRVNLALGYGHCQALRLFAGFEPPRPIPQLPPPAAPLKPNPPAAAGQTPEAIPRAAEVLQIAHSGATRMPNLAQLIGSLVTHGLLGLWVAVQLSDPEVRGLERAGLVATALVIAGGLAVTLAAIVWRLRGS